MSHSTPHLLLLPDPPATDASRGFSLIEVLIAITVFAIGILAVITMQTTSVGGNAKARYISEASGYAADRMELLLSKKYSDIDLVDTDADGLAGLTDSQCCPGGNDPWGVAVTGCTTIADHCSLLPPANQYGMFWNVADNQPIINMKTVKVLVTSPLLNAPVIIDFAKADVK